LPKGNRTAEMPQRVLDNHEKNKRADSALEAVRV